MSDSIPGKFSFPALLAAVKEEELELPGGSITPVQSERSLSFGDYYDFAEVNSMDVVKTEEAADENADGVTSALKIQPAAACHRRIKIGGSGVNSSTAATAEAAAATAARKAKITRAKVARNLERKQRIEMILKGTLPGSSYESVQRG